jgi:hypothetical protein
MHQSQVVVAVVVVAVVVVAQVAIYLYQVSHL